MSDTIPPDWRHWRQDLICVYQQLVKIENLLATDPDSPELVSLVNGYRREYGRDPEVHPSLIDRLARVPRGD
jgi:hypothetical protein